MPNGKFNIIGDAFDEAISAMPVPDIDVVFGDLMGFDESDIPDDADESVVPLDESKVGDLVRFGKFLYYVVVVEGNKRLLLSKECLTFDFDWKYAEDGDYDLDAEDDFQWVGSVYRKYLNGYFLNAMIQPEQRKRILPVEHVCYGTAGEQIIQDKVFLLSKDELERYVPKELWPASVHVMFNDVLKPYFLRVDHVDQVKPYVVETDGSIDQLADGYGINRFRPAMWVE